MALEDKGAQHDKVIVDKYIDPAGSVEMSTRDYVVRPSALTAPMVIVLPAVAEAKGRFYSIVARAASAINTITISDKDDSECWEDIVFNGPCDAMLLYSDGLFWHRLANTTFNFAYGYDFT